MTEKKKKVLGGVLVVVLLVAGAYYLGKKSAGNAGANFGQNGRNVRGGRLGGGMVVGEILTKDGSNMTVKLRNGGSQIIFFSTSTEVSRSAAGSVSDLNVGESVNISGVVNSDGSFTAQNIQIRPVRAGGFGR